MQRLVAISILLVACGESFPPASAVDDFRVVAARVGIDGAPQRANPRPEETVEVSLLSIDSGKPPSDEPESQLSPGLLQWAVVPCVPAPVTIGPPICTEALEPCEGCDETPPSDPLATPVVRFEAPSQEALDEAQATSLLLQGIVCSNGTPSRDAIVRFLMGESDDLTPCEGPAIVAGVPIQGRFVTIPIPIEEDPDDPNLNPELLDILLDGASWPPPYERGVPRDAPATGCATDLEELSESERDLHPRAGDSPSSVDLYVTAESLQTYVEDDMPVTEEIQVSWLGDGGEFDVSFSFITAPATSVLTQWKPFVGVPDDGALVRFNFVVRDGRGGTDWVERGLCILPSEPEPSPP